ncbi:MAG: RNA polymerase sigma factor, partial [Oscillospiraceae bacterium]|nr:RNA polymerase sigma factor [Oscillospiraceae bacterium]
MDNIAEQSSVSELFERISDEYSMILLNWAYKKTGSRTDAEDLAQEVLAQVFRSAKKEQYIEKLDNFIWKIAHFVWCSYLKENVVLRSCVSIDSFDYDFLPEKDHAEKYFEEEEMKDNIKKMRLKISNLNYLQREIMIMHYIDELPIKSISQKLNITEANVKWHLYDTRKKLKKEINEMNNVNYVYRPGKLHMAVSGNPGPAPDTNKINESLTKQNICLACYREAKTPAELAETLGIAQAYIEFDLEWLIEKQFMKNDNGRYSTIFSINSPDFSAKIANVFLRNKENFSDEIIEKFMSKQDKIKALNFYGSDQPMEKLLWFLIYRFINFVDYKVTYEENKYPQPERPIMPDGGQYFPLGFEQPETHKKTVEFLNDEYRKIHKWDCNGSMCNPRDKISLYWIGLYNAGRHTIERLFSSEPNNKYYQTYQLFCKTLNQDFNLNDLNDTEKEILSEMISYGWVSKKDDKIIHNFCIFTHEQEKALINIFAEIYEEMKDEIYKIFTGLEKFCRTDLPKHLDFYTNYHIYMAFYNAI